MSMAVNVSATTKARSDQLNADDLIGAPITVSILGVSETGKSDQPIAIEISGGHQCYKPCKTMRRILVSAWGGDGAAYVGKSLTLYRNPEVRFGGEQVGGIEISHMTGLAKPLEIMLQVSRGKKKKYTVSPLRDHVAEWQAKITDCETTDALKKLGQQLSKSGLNATDLATLRDAYRVRERSLTESPKPEATDLAQQNDPAQSFDRRIELCNTSTDAAQLTADIRAAAESGQISADERDELLDRLQTSMT